VLARNPGSGTPDALKRDLVRLKRILRF
jgi:hypothetical protein